MATDKQYNPKLELKLNDEARVKLLRDKCYEGETASGPYYLYTVEHDGVVKSFFAPAEIHDQVVAHKMKAGSEFILRAVAGENGKRGKMQLSFEPVHPALPEGGNAETDNFKAIMQQSLKDAIEIMQAVNTIPFQNADIRALSSCLFIARTRT